MWTTAGWGAVAAGLLALLCLRWVDSTSPGLLMVLQAGQPLWLLLTAVAAALALWRQRLRWLVPALVVVLAVAGQTAMRVQRAPDPPAKPVGELRLLSVNAYFGTADPVPIVRLVRDQRVDVLVVVEATPSLLSALDDAGLSRSHPHRSHAPADDGASGSLILCRVACDPVPGTVPPDDGSEALTVFEQPAVVVHADGGDVVVRAAHPFPPIDPGRDAWRDALHSLDQWQRDRPEDRVVLAGDFNASAGHPPFRRLLGALDDSAEATGQVLTRTWPHGRRVVPPFVALDHVLTRGMVVRSHEIVHVPGSDHDGVLVDLVW